MKTPSVPIRLRRLPMTLLEILVVIAILAVVSGIVGVSINKALVEQRFRTEVGMIVDELRLAQDIMLILKKDVHVIFVEDKTNGGIDFWLDMDTILPPNIQREVQRHKSRLKTVKGVFFHDELLSETSKGRLEVKFLSNGAIMSRGMMRLATSDNENPPPNTLENYIYLPGYPKPVFSSNTLEEAKKVGAENDAGFAERLTRDTVQRVPESAKKRETPTQAESPPQTEENDKDKSKKNSLKLPKKMMEMNE